MFGRQSGGRFGSQCGCLCLESDSTSGVQCDACLAVSLVVDLEVSVAVYALSQTVRLVFSATHVWPSVWW